MIMTYQTKSNCCVVVDKGHLECYWGNKIVYLNKKDKEIIKYLNSHPECNIDEFTNYLVQFHSKKDFQILFIIRKHGQSILYSLNGLLDYEIAKKVISNVEETSVEAYEDKDLDDGIEQDMILEFYKQYEIVKEERGKIILGTIFKNTYKNVLNSKKLDLYMITEGRYSGKPVSTNEICIQNYNLEEEK